jgi:hypothetical protein
MIGAFSLSPPPDQEAGQCGQQGGQSDKPGQQNPQK